MTGAWKSVETPLSRPHLNAWMDAGASADVIIVQAPGGSGKVALIEDWLSRRPRDERAIWIEIDEAARSAEGLSAALHRALAAEDLVDDASDGAWTVSLPTGVQVLRVVVLHAHRLSLRAEEALLRYAGARPDVQFIIASRRRGRIDSAALEPTAARAIVEIPVAAFSVTEGEVQALARGLDAEVSAAQARRLRDATDGHLLTLRVVLGDLYAGDSAPGAKWLDLDAVVATAERRVTDMVLPPLSERELRAAMLFAHAPFTDAALAQRLWSEPDAREMLDSLIVAGVGEVDGEGRFSFPGFVRRALLRRADVVLSPEARRSARVWAAESLARCEGHEVAALRLYVEAGATDRITAFFAAHFEALLQQSREVETILMMLSEEEIAQDGTIGIALAILREPTEPIPSAGTLQRVAAGIAEIRGRGPARNRREEFFRGLAIFAGLRVVRRLDEANEVGEHILRLSRTIECAARTETAEGFNLGVFQVAQSRMLTGDFERGLQILDLLEADPRRGERRRGLRAFAYAVRGESERAASILEQTNGLDRDHPTPPHLPHVLVQAIVHIEQGHPHDALGLLREIEAQLWVNEHWAFALSTLALAHLALQPQIGLDDIERLHMQNHGRPASSAAMSMLDAARADLAIASGEYARARAILDGDTGSSTPLQLVRARLALLSGGEDARQDLRDVLAGPPLWPRARANALVLLAVHEHRFGAPEAAQLSLRRAHALALTTGMRSPFMMIPGPDLHAIAESADIALPDATPDPFGAVLIRIDLTARERIVLHELATRDPLAVIAARQHLSINTIKSQAASVYRKFQVGSRHEVVSAARRQGYLCEETP